MSFWNLLQIFLDIVFLAMIGFCWVRLTRPAKDDPRLSRGLQLLQSKISVLEDLSDRTETQVNQLSALLEQKCRDVQSYVVQADKQIQKIESSMGKSMEVAKIFQDRIPHQEIIERQNTIKYVKAARLAHQGMPVEEIAQQVDLSRGEIELIAKVNRQQLQFSVEDLPQWAQESQGESDSGDFVSASIASPLASAVVGPLSKTALPENKKQVLSQLGNQFRQAIHGQDDIMPAQQAPVAEAINKPPAPVVPKAIVSSVEAENKAATGPVIKKVIFPRISGEDYKLF